MINKSMIKKNIQILMVMLHLPDILFAIISIYHYRFSLKSLEKIVI